MKVFNSGKLYYRQPEAFVCTTKKLSFGCIFYEMLSGDQLFERCSDSSTCEENAQEIDEWSDTKYVTGKFTCKTLRQ